MLMSKWSVYLTPSVNIDEDPSQSRCAHTVYAMFNVPQLQENIAALYLSGKPLIDGALTLRTPFTFVSSPASNQ